MNASKSTTIVYTLAICPNCKIAKKMLKENDIPFEEKDLNDSGVKTDLMMDNVFPMAAPVIFHNDEYLMNVEELTEALTCPQ